MQVVRFLCCLLSSIYFDIPIWTLLCLPSPCPVFISSPLWASLGKLHTNPNSISHLLRENALFTVFCITIFIFTFWWSCCNSSLLLVAWVTVFALLTLPLKKIVGELSLLYTNTVFSAICWSHWSTISMLQPDFYVWKFTVYMTTLKKGTKCLIE